MDAYLNCVRRLAVVAAGLVSIASAIALTAVLVRPGVIDVVPTVALVGVLVLALAPALTVAASRVANDSNRRAAHRRESVERSASVDLTAEREREIEVPLPTLAFLPAHDVGAVVKHAAHRPRRAAYDLRAAIASDVVNERRATATGA